MVAWLCSSQRLLNGQSARASVNFDRLFAGCVCCPSDKECIFAALAPAFASAACFSRSVVLVLEGSSYNLLPFPILVSLPNIVLALWTSLDRRCFGYCGGRVRLAL